MTDSDRVGDSDPLEIVSTKSAQLWAALCRAYQLLGFDTATGGNGDHLPKVTPISWSHEASRLGRTDMPDVIPNDYPSRTKRSAYRVHGQATCERLSSPTVDHRGEDRLVSSKQPDVVDL
ncbi:hypothetical protein [Mycobacterium decipiens]|uniref:Uncharacterized protein n=1 Tax=Mycobacterium decipiens TaxID=1430326 RepID=A0A1X2LW07_9MYCO|nr:hypothetical protein [Mycobacterium decipiens]OSC40651.1 hypothetical protein B8W66_12270 [Mycobacterium decipiens]